MLLSILIPTYNYDCTQLVEALISQSGSDVEVVVGNDGSSLPEVCDALSRLSGYERVRVVNQTVNRGRSSIRNLLAREAYGDYLLFLDADGIPVRKDFVDNYLKLLPTNDIVCGSVVLSPLSYSKDCSLRYVYERLYERKMTHDRRNLRPYMNFRTFNFLIPRSVMLSCPFDENIVLPGYEDVLLGKLLREKGYKVVHIVNDLANFGIENNEDYLKKVEQQLVTLHSLSNELEGFSSLLATYSRLKAFRMTWLMALLFNHTKKFMRRNLFSPHPSVMLFQIYKLGFFCTLQKK